MATQKESAPRRRRDLRRQRLIKGMVEGKPVSHAALDAGYSRSVAKSAVYRMIKSPAFLRPLAQAMDRAGILDARLLADLEAALGAQETKFFAHQGKVIDQKDVVAWDARLRALEIALRLKRYLRAGEDDPPPPPVVPIHLYLGLPPGPPPASASGPRPALPGRIVEEPPDHA